MNWQVEFTKPALEQLQGITDKRIRGILFERAEALATDPENQGKPLRGELSGFRSLKVYRQRYRIIYRVEREKVIVVVIAIGIRKEGDRADVYQIVVRLIRSGHINF